MRIVWQTTLVKDGERPMKVTKLSREFTEIEMHQFQLKLDAAGKLHRKVKKIPSVRQMTKWYIGDGTCPTPDGCIVEPDGQCIHGWDAWLKIMGII